MKRFAVSVWLKNGQTHRLVLPEGSYMVWEIQSSAPSVDINGKYWIFNWDSVQHVEAEEIGEVVS